MRWFRAALFIMVVGLLFGREARAETWQWSTDPKPSYLGLCPTNDATRKRDRICSAYISASFKQEAMPEQALFLRERLIALIENYDRSANWAYDWYHRLVAAALVIAAISAVWTWWRGTDVQRIAVFGGILAVIIAALTAFGYNTQFKAHFAASRNLTVVKDQIELALIGAARENRPIETATVAAWNDSYQKIVAKHVEDFGGAFTPPVALLGQ